MLVLGGLALRFVPGLPVCSCTRRRARHLLPPLLSAAAYFTSLRELRANVRPIWRSRSDWCCDDDHVAAVAHGVARLDWAARSCSAPSSRRPTRRSRDRRRLGVPGGVVTIVEGESLVNDGTALVAYRFAVAAVVDGSFCSPEAGGSSSSGLGGVAVGLVVGYVIAGSFAAASTTRRSRSRSRS